MINTEYPQENWNKDCIPVNKTINEFKKLIEDIDGIIRNLNSNESIKGTDLLNKQKENVKMVEDYLEKSKIEITSYINQITDRTRGFHSVTEERYDVQENSNRTEASLLLQDLNYNQEFLEKRRKELEDIHKISEKTKDTTNYMVKQIDDQGAILDDLEGPIIETKKNTENAKKEIVKAEETSRDNRKRMICIIVIIFLLLFLIGGIILSLILSK